MIHAPPNPARALPPPPVRLPPLPPPLPNFHPPCSRTAVNSASSALSLASAPPPRRRSGLLGSGPRSRTAGCPLSHPAPQTRGAQGAVAATALFQSFLTPRTRRTLQVCAPKGARGTHGLPGAPSPHPAAGSAPPALHAELCLSRGPLTDHLLEPLTHTPLPVCAAGVTDLLTVAAAPRSIFCPPPPPARFPSKSGGWRREKKKPVLKGAVRTDLSAAEEDPRSGRALQPVGTLERRARAEWQLRSARCPLGRSAPPPPSAQRSPPQRRGPGNPPARFFVQFQQSSEEVGPFVPLFIDCVNIAKRRRRSGGPSPAPRPAPWREKPQHTT